jgi:DNA-binding CsgD family transcriptional regulator
VVDGCAAPFGSSADLPRMQRQIILETSAADRKRAEVARRLGISVNTVDNSLHAAFRSLRHRLTQDADVSADVDRSLWCDRIEELPDRYASALLRRASGKTGECSTTEGDRSNSERDRGKNSRAGAASPVAPARS